MTSLNSAQIDTYFREVQSMVNTIILDLEKVNYSMCQEMKKQVPERRPS